MANLLYITCNLSFQEQSRSLSFGYEVLREYLQLNQTDKVHMLDLYRDAIPCFDLDIHNSLRRMMNGESESFLTDTERRKITRMYRLADQFRICDKYIFVTHSLNLWFPAEFKMYIDAVCVLPHAIHFALYEAEENLLGKVKKSLHIHAVSSCGGTEKDQSVGYLASLLKFFGVLNQNVVILHGDEVINGAEDEDEMIRRKLKRLVRGF